MLFIELGNWNHIMFQFARIQIAWSQLDHTVELRRHATLLWSTAAIVAFVDRNLAITPHALCVTNTSAARSLANTQRGNHAKQRRSRATQRGCGQA
jgi:hypothetical protein